MSMSQEAHKIYRADGYYARPDVKQSMYRACNNMDAYASRVDGMTGVGSGELSLIKEEARETIKAAAHKLVEAAASARTLEKESDDYNAFLKRLEKVNFVYCVFLPLIH